MSIQNGTSLTKEALEYLVGLIRDISGLDSKLIDDINLKTNGTYSSVRIKSLIDKNLEEANKHTEDLISALNKLSSKKTTIQPTLNNSEFNIIYLYSTDGNAPFEQYLKIGTNDSDAELISLGSTNISLDEYLTVLEASQTYAKQVDLDTTNNTLTTHINNSDIHLTEDEKNIVKEFTDTNDKLSYKGKEIGKNEVEISWADYQALSDDEKNSDTTYYIPDMPDMPVKGVQDIPLTDLNFTSETNYRREKDLSRFGYRVINGICYVTLNIICISPIDNVTVSKLPKPKKQELNSCVNWSNDSETTFLRSYVYTNGELSIGGGKSGVGYILNFSYPVAES